MPKQGQFIFHDFYCINCGNKSYTLPRKTSKLKEQFHRKLLFCPKCKKERTIFKHKKLFFLSQRK